VWEASVDGRPLTFHLAGINNQNFIMRDDETGSWWQQVTGEAILGPLKGRRLKQVLHDELNFGQWKRERPDGRILAASRDAEGHQIPRDWEERYAKFPVPKGREGGDVDPRTLVIGVTAGGASKAYPLDELRKQSPVLDEVGGEPIVLVVGDDGRSVRAFTRVIGGATVDLFAKPGASPLRLVDSATGTEWNFAGEAVEGELRGRRLTKVAVLEDYWFDWKTYHPDTTIYTAR
jgi:hypothetical protein